MTKIYVTKYALSDGIIETTTRDEDVTALNLVHADIGHGLYVQMGREAFLTREEAELRVSDMASRRIESLKKQIKKLQPLVAKPKWQNLNFLDTLKRKKATREEAKAKRK